MAYKTFAAIDVGSYELTMKIFEISSKNNTQILQNRQLKQKKVYPFHRPLVPFCRGVHLSLQ